MNKKKKAIKIPEFISSGSTELNLALSGKVDGGWMIGRIANIVGDKSTGKTLLAIEAITYVLKVLGKHMKVKTIYHETESAFDKSYAEGLGMPIDKVDFRRSPTIEEWYRDINDLIEKEDYDFLLYVLDSLDAIETKVDKERDIDKGTFGTAKARLMGEFLRKLAPKIEKKNVILMIISQERDKIGVVFGKKTTRSGGRALDYYASQILWLHERGKIKSGNRIDGIKIRGKVEKNKVSNPSREAEFPILFGYGIDDVGSMVDYLIDKEVITKDGNRWTWKDEKYFKEALIKVVEECKPEIIKLMEDTWDKEENKDKKIRKPKYE